MRKSIIDIAREIDLAHGAPPPVVYSSATNEPIEEPMSERLRAILRKHKLIRARNESRNRLTCAECVEFRTVSGYCGVVRASRPAQCLDPDGRSREITAELQRTNTCPRGRFVATEPPVDVASMGVRGGVERSSA